MSLSVDAVLHESTIYGRREKLIRMTDGSELEDVYGATIERIKAQAGDKSRLGMEALMWISHAERPLEADELCHALAVKLGSTDFNTDNVPLISTLVGCCQGLITVDKEASTVRLIHFTLREYLFTHPDVFSGPHSAMAEICLTFLGSRQVKSLSLDMGDTPFLSYCSVYWGVHAKRELSGCVKSLAVELLKENYGQIQTKLLLEQAPGLYLPRRDTCSPFSGLHCASFFGIVEVVASLIEMECYDTNEGDFMGRTPLAWAAHNGHEEVVRILIGREEVNTDKPDRNGKTPLSHAARGGHEGVVKLLLELEEVNPDLTDGSGRTSLSYAAGSGHEGVVEILLEREEINPDKPDSHGQTPLSNAAQGGHEGVVKLLLERGEVNPDLTDSSGRTPFSYAARYDHEGVVKLLLEREEVNPDLADGSGRTPLSYASWGPHDMVWWWRSRRRAGAGNEGVVQLLLEREEVNPDLTDSSGRTPLSYAAGSGREGVVKLLLEREEVNPDLTDSSGRTPLSYATINGHDRVAAMLQSRKAVTPTTI